MIDGVQRLATKLMHGMEHLSYDSRLTKLGLMRLSSRRSRSDLVETFKITSDTYGISTEEFLSLVIVAGEAILKSHLRKYVDLMLENIL